MELLKLCVALHCPHTPHNPIPGAQTFWRADWSSIEEAMMEKMITLNKAMATMPQDPKTKYHEPAKRESKRSALQHWLKPDTSIKEQQLTDARKQEVRNKILYYPWIISTTIAIPMSHGFSNMGVFYDCPQIKTHTF